MFKPNSKCRVRANVHATDVYGQPSPGGWRNEACSVVKLTISSEKSSVRADTSASRGNAMELVANLKILFLPTVKMDIDDTLELNGCQFRVLGLAPRSDVNGRPDHIEVLANIWRKL